MSVRKRSWKSKGETKTAWVVDYCDQRGRRHIKTFARRHNADAFHSKVAVDVSAGIHTPDRESITVAAAGELWMRDRGAAGLERTTLMNYRVYLDRHITPAIGTARLSQLTVPAARAFEDRLRAQHSPTLVRAILGALGAIIADAQERGLVAQNVVRSLRSRRRTARQGLAHREAPQGQAQDRHRHPGAGRDARHHRWRRHARGRDRWRPLLLTLIFTGLRACELRGLRWSDIDLKRGELHVRQRADPLQQDRAAEVGGGRAHGAAAADGGERVARVEARLPERRAWSGVPRPPWMRTSTASIIVEQGFDPAQIAAGVVNRDGKAKYTGLHSLRHFYASWCINRRVDGGLELPLKVVQARLGHASIQMTADTYGHLFPRGDDGSELAAAERHRRCNSNQATLRRLASREERGRRSAPRRRVDA